MTIFKICGLRDSQHAIAAAESGAYFLGFAFVEGVRRQLLEDEAQIVLDEFRGEKLCNSPKLVGLFANQPINFVNHIVNKCGLDYVQLCGDEPLDFWNNVEASVIKQVRVNDEGVKENVTNEVLRRVDEVLSQGHIALLDKHESGSLGGTGRTFDWSIAREIASRFDVLLAGGLSPDNVGEAISTVRPWGVDVSSGVETNGVKDSRKIIKFGEEVRAVSLP